MRRGEKGRRKDWKSRENIQSWFLNIVLENQYSMFRTARAILDNNADEEDACQEAILRAWIALEKLKNPDSARSWLLKITVNAAYSIRRKQKKLVCVETLPETEAEEPEEKHRLREKVEKLREKLRLVIVLYYYEGFTVAEISEILRISQGTVKSRLSRGREQLRPLLREEE